MKKMCASILLAISPFALAQDAFQPELFDVEKVDAIMADQVLLNDQMVPAVEVGKALYMIGEVYTVQDTGKWESFDTLSALEEGIEGQAPLHIADFKLLKELKDPTYWLYKSDKEDVATDNFLYVEVDGKVVLVNFWRTPKGIEHAQFGKMFETSENRYNLPESVKKSLDKVVSNKSGSYFGKSGYRQDKELLVDLIRPFAEETSTLYKKEVDDGPSISAPYLWGKYFIPNEDTVKLIHEGNQKTAQAAYEPDQFSMSLYGSLDEFEAYVGAHIPLRQEQLTWIEAVGQDYYILHGRFEEGRLFEYNDFLHFYTVKGHKPFLTMMLDTDDYYQER